MLRNSKISSNAVLSSITLRFTPVVINGVRNAGSWFKRDKDEQSEPISNVFEGLKKAYRTKLLPLEKEYRFHEFHSPPLEDCDFDSKPSIMFVGQYSTGKTSLIKYLLEKDFPGIRIGPEPTTDRFISIMYGDNDGIIPGNALVVDPTKQFGPLSKFGNSFLNRFQCSLVNSPVLKDISVIDTPGILSGEKQRVDRGYDFTGVLEWFAERVDRIILLFDAHKLDISDEFRRSIEALRRHDDKIRIVLNKSDMVTQQQLMRVYGALMWSLGKVLNTPEVARVYIGSFWDEPLRYDANRKLFEDEERDLFEDLQSLPRNAAIRKLNDLIKRSRLAKAHAYIISEFSNNMPTFLNKDKKKTQLINSLDLIYKRVCDIYKVPIGDLPDIIKMRESLLLSDIHSPLNMDLINAVENMLSKDIAHIMSLIPQESFNNDVKGGVFVSVQNEDSPFGYKSNDGIDAGQGDPDWIVLKHKHLYDEIFSTLVPSSGKISGRVAKSEMIKSKLPNSVLGKIWNLSDVDKDGLLDSDEFALAMYLIDLKLDGHEIPSQLPDHLIPPSKKLDPFSSSNP